MTLSNGTNLLSKAFDSRLCFLFISVLILLGIAQPIYAVSSGITYAGRILDSDDAPVTASSVIFTITINDPSGKCWLYSEQRNLDLSQTAGTFSFEIGSSDISNLYGAAPTFNNQSSGGPTNLAELFSNKKSFTGLGTANGCMGSYDPTLATDPNEGRLLSVYFRVGASGVDQAIPPMRITAVPLAMQALAVNGYGTGELLRVDKSIVASSGVNNDPLSLAQYTEFWSLVNKSSTSYLPVTGDTNIVGGNNKLTSLLGQTLPAGPATNGQVLVSNGTTWTLQSMSGGGGSVGSVGGTSPISVGGTATAPVISLSAASTSVDGYLTSTDWNTFNSKQSSSLSSGKVFVGNASGVATEANISGDATINNAAVLTLKNTGTAGTYGSGSLVPVITTDAQGRVTGVTTAAPLDTTKLPLSGGTMSGALNMGAQDITNVGNITMAASKTLGLSSNAVDPGSPTAGQIWYNSTSNIVKYYDGTSVQSLGVAGVGISSLNGLTSGTQTFAVGTSGNSPAFSSATSTHTLNIPMASTSSVTAGLISKTDYDAFNSKLSAISNVANLAATKIWIGDASGVAQAFALSGDAMMTSGGVVTVDKTTTAQSNKLLSLDGSGVAVSMGNQLNGVTSGSVVLQASGATTNYSLTFPATQGSAGQTLANNGSGILSWASALTNSLASGKIWVGNASNVSAEVSLSGDATLDNAGVVTVDKTQAAVANKILQLTANSVAVTKGTDIGGAGTGVAHILYPNTATNTTLTLPSSAGSANQVLQTDGAGVLTWVTPLNTNTAFVNGGNTFAGNSSIGNNDNYNLSFKTNGATRMTILNSGGIGIGTASPTASLEVAGAIRTPTVPIAAGTTTLDLSQSNFFSVAFTTNTCTALTLDNLLDGGSYTIATSGATSGTCSFTATGLTFKYAPANAAVTTDSIYTMVRVGSIVYVSWITGFQ